MAIIFFMVYVLNFRFRTLASEIHEAEHDHVRITDFSVEIDKLPAQIADHGNFEQALGAHIQERLEAIRGQRKSRANEPVLPPAKVCEVCLVRDYGKRLSSIKSRAELMRRKEIEVYKGA